MESKTNTLLIGLFVVMLGAGMAGFLIWMGRIGGESGYTRYTVYLRESVAGIQNDSAVRYMGVNVGQVETIRINPSNSEEIEVDLKIRTETPVKTDTRAELKVFGVTGLTYIELSGGSQNAPLLSAGPSGQRIIPASKSAMNRVADAMGTLSERMLAVLEGMERVLSAKNAKNLDTTLENLAVVTRELRGIRGEFDALVRQTAGTEENLSGRVSDTLTSVKEGSRKMGEAGDAVKASTAKFQQMLARADTLLAESNATMHTVNTQTLVRAQALIDEMRAMVATYDRAGRKIEARPSRLIWGE